MVLISTPGTTTECVWRGLEVGAAEVLEKPLSLLKLQNIWQHVVRKVCVNAIAKVYFSESSDFVRYSQALISLELKSDIHSNFSSRCQKDNSRLVESWVTL